MSDGREEREEFQKRREQEKREDRDDRFISDRADLQSARGDRNVVEFEFSVGVCRRQECGIDDRNLGRRYRCTSRCVAHATNKRACLGNRYAC